MGFWTNGRLEIDKRMQEKKYGLRRTNKEKIWTNGRLRINRRMKEKRWGCNKRYSGRLKFGREKKIYG